jgi:hypothetical protein
MGDGRGEVVGGGDARRSLPKHDEKEIITPRWSNTGGWVIPSPDALFHGDVSGRESIVIFFSFRTLRVVFEHSFSVVRRDGILFRICFLRRRPTRRSLGPSPNGVGEGVVGGWNGRLVCMGREIKYASRIYMKYTYVRDILSIQRIHEYPPPPWAFEAVRRKGRCRSRIAPSPTRVRPNESSYPPRVGLVDTCNEEPQVSQEVGSLVSVEQILGM